MTDKDIVVKFTELKGQIQTLDRHEKEFSKRLDLIDIGLVDINTSIKIMLSKIEKLPERVRDIELEKARNDGYMNNVVKPFFLVFIGMVVSFVFNNIIFAPREEKYKPRTEIRK